MSKDIELSTMKNSYRDPSNTNAKYANKSHSIDRSQHKPSKWRICCKKNTLRGRRAELVLLLIYKARKISTLPMVGECVNKTKLIVRYSYSYIYCINNYTTKIKPPQHTYQQFYKLT